MTNNRYRHKITAQTFDAPSLAEPAEVDVIAEWGAPDAVRGVRMNLAIGTPGSVTSMEFLDLELSLDQAHELAASLITAAEAREAHPPTPAEVIQGAIEDVRDLHPATDEQGREYIRVHDLLHHPEVAALDAEELLSGVGDTADDGFYEFSAVAGDEGDAIRYQSRACTRVMIGRHH